MSVHIKQTTTAIQLVNQYYILVEKVCKQFESSRYILRTSEDFQIFLHLSSNTESIWTPKRNKLKIYVKKKQ